MASPYEQTMSILHQHGVGASTQANAQHGVEDDDDGGEDLIEIVKGPSPVGLQDTPIPDTLFRGASSVHGIKLQDRGAPPAVLGKIVGTLPSYATSTRSIATRAWLQTCDLAASRDPAMCWIQASRNHGMYATLLCFQV